MNMSELIELLNAQFVEMGVALMVAETDAGFYQVLRIMTDDKKKISFTDSFDAYVFLRQRAKTKCLASNMAVMLHGTPVMGC